MPQILLDFSASVKLKNVKLGYHYLVNHILTFLLVPVMAGVLIVDTTFCPTTYSKSGSKEKMTKIPPEE